MTRAFCFLLCTSLVLALWVTGVQAQERAAPGLPGYPVVSEGYPSAPHPYGPAITTREATRLRALEADLHLLAARSDGRYVDGGLSLALGVGFATLGVFVDDPLFRSLLFLTGGVAAARGVIELTVLPDAEKPALEFTRMPTLSTQQILARLAYGEEALARIARKTRVARLLDGSITLAAGAAYVPLYILLQNIDDDRWKYGDDPGDYVIVAFAGISVAAGLITLIVKSEAERTALSYRRLRDRLAHDEKTSRWPSLAPYASRDGAGIAATLRF